MPRKNPRLTALRRRKARRKVGFLVGVLLLAALVVLYLSGLYIYPVMALRDSVTSLQLRFTPGGGFPAAFSLTGYAKSQPLSDGNFAALGDKDVVITSATGRELHRIQHGYANPGMMASGTRVCVYHRGGKDYTVESRTGTLLHRTTEEEILFCTLSPGGWLAVVTSSRYRADLEIYNPVYEAQPQLTIGLVDEKPVLATFHSDNRNLVLATLSAREGALGTTLHFLRTDREEELALARADGARIVQAQFISQSRLLALYDTYAALYNMDGEETARFDYGGRSLQAAHIGDGGTSLVFGSGAYETLELTLLDHQLEAQFEVRVPGGQNPRVLTGGQGVFLLCGEEVMAYDKAGQRVGSRGFTAKPLDLVQGGEALALTVNAAEGLDDLLRPGQASGVSGSAAASTAAGQSQAAKPSSSLSPSSAPSGSSAPGSTSGSAPPQGEDPSNTAPQTNPEVQ